MTTYTLTIYDGFSITDEIDQYQNLGKNELIDHLLETSRNGKHLFLVETDTECYEITSDEIINAMENGDFDFIELIGGETK